jgi:hypothetical protein
MLWKTPLNIQIHQEQLQDSVMVKVEEASKAEERKAEARKAAIKKARAEEIVNSILYIILKRHIGIGV